jgi:hypothetical protein
LPLGREAQWEGAKEPQRVMGVSMIKVYCIHV